MVHKTRPERRTRRGDDFARALLAVPDGLTFDELLDAAPDATPGDLAAWLGHAVTEGLVDDIARGVGEDRAFRLRARGRRLVSAGRRSTRNTIS